MDSNHRSQERDIVYCHQCENEWYRDEHGLVCPECQSDFTEIVEADHDPRNDEQHIPGDTAVDRLPQNYNDFHAPDPDEDDIDDLRLEETGPGRYRLRGTYRTTMGGNGPQGGQGQGQPSGLMGLVGNVLQGMLGGQQQGAQQGQQIDAHQRQQLGPNGPGRPGSAPGSPEQDGQRQPGNGTFIRHGQGPGFTYTIASSSNFSPGLLPRNAHGPQPFQHQPDHIEQMLNQMMMNIGAMPGGGPMGGGMRMGPGGHPFHDHDQDGFAGGPFIIGGGGGPGGLGPFAQLFNLFGPPGGVAGDAVYTQEALDRIITQLMEQHQAGNAPGPASEAAIKALPRRQISKADQGENGKAECSICMDEVEIGGTVSVLPCTHWFHHECIKAWLLEHDTCPHCRQGIMPKEDLNANQPRSPSQQPLHDMRSPQYTRPAVPGAFPFPRQNSGGVGSPDGSMQNPFQVPDSPTMNRRNSTGDRRGSRSSGGGVFSRMRDAFSSNRDNSNGNGSRG